MVLGTTWYALFPDQRAGTLFPYRIDPVAQLVCVLPGPKRPSHLAGMEPVAWFDLDRVGGVGVLAGRNSRFGRRSTVDNDPCAGRVLLGDLSARLRHPVLPDIFVRSALSPLYGPAPVCCAVCHHRISSKEFD